MSVTIPDKVYFRIGEVGRILGVEPYVIRYWESEFKTVRPTRTRSNHRLYKKNDLQELLKIKDLLYKDRYSIAGAKKKLSAGESSHPDTEEGVSKEIIAYIKKELQDIRNILARSR